MYKKGGRTQTVVNYSELMKRSVLKWIFLTNSKTSPKKETFDVQACRTFLHNILVLFSTYLMWFEQIVNYYSDNENSNCWYEIGLLRSITIELRINSAKRHQCLINSELLQLRKIIIFHLLSAAYFSKLLV